MWHIYFIMWVSWAGKWTLISHIKNLNFENLYIPLSYKTRSIRENEQNGVDAWFISREDFFAWVQAWEFLEYALVHDLDYYGTKYKDVFENGIDKWKIVIKELDIIWLEELRKNKPELDDKYTTIFLNIPEEILKKRIEQRGAFMSNEELGKRLNSAVIEEEKAKILCNYMIDATQSPEQVLQQVIDIIKNREL